MAVSCAADIRPLFRESPDIDTMSDYGLDLSSYADVKAHAAKIYDWLANGSMPWSEEDVELFNQWMEGGFAGRR